MEYPVGPTTIQVRSLLDHGHQQQPTCCFYLFHSGRVKWENDVHQRNKMLCFSFLIDMYKKQYLKNIEPGMVSMYPVHHL